MEKLNQKEKLQRRAKRNNVVNVKRINPVSSIGLYAYMIISLIVIFSVIIGIYVKSDSFMDKKLNYYGDAYKVETSKKLDGYDIIIKDTKRYYRYSMSKENIHMKYTTDKKAKGYKIYEELVDKDKVYNSYLGKVKLSLLNTNKKRLVLVMPLAESQKFDGVIEEFKKEDYTVINKDRKSIINHQLLSFLDTYDDFSDDERRKYVILLSLTGILVILINIIGVALVLPYVMKRYKLDSIKTN